MTKKLKYPFIFALTALAVGGLSAIFTNKNMHIYSEINLPFFAPPSWIFPVVWAILYVLMGVGMGLVTNAPRYADEKKNALFFFFLQLVVNFFWGIFFFNLMLFKASFIWLSLLLALIILMTSSFFRVSRWAGYLQIPYIAWVFFAGILNLAVAILN